MQAGKSVRVLRVVGLLVLALGACAPAASPTATPPVVADTLAPAYPLPTAYPPLYTPPSWPVATSFSRIILQSTATPTPLFRPTAAPTPWPTRTPTPVPTFTATPAPPAWTPALDDSYGPADAVAALVIEVNGQWQPYYLTPAGNMKPVFPLIPGFNWNSFAVRAEAFRFLCWAELGRGMAALDPSSGQVITATQAEGYYLETALASPDGRWLAYLEGKPIGGGELMGSAGNHWWLRAWEVETGRVYDLAEETGTSAPLPIFWSPATGKVYWTTGIPRTEACCSGLWGALPTGEGQEELPTDVGFSRQLSPDGRQVLFARFNPELGETFMEGIWTGGSLNEVALLDLVDREVRLLWQAAPGCQLGSGGWLPEGEIVLGQVCPVEEQYQRDVFTVDLGGTKGTLLWSDRSSELYPPGLYIPPAGNWLLARDTVRWESVWYLLDRRTGEKQLLPDSGRIYWTWCGQDRLAYTVGGDPRFRSRLDVLNVVTGESALLWEGPGAQIDDILFCH